MTDWLLPVLFAIFIWWFSTGVVILLDGLPHRTFRWSLVISSLLAVGALLGLARTASQTNPADAYCAFTCALLLWGWHELSFLTGWITGPRKWGHTEGCSRWRHALQAIQVILWHELWLLLSLSLLAAITWNQPNQIGLWTFAGLWLMRASAKLNLFLGVRNLGLEFLPPHLAYLRHYFRQANMNRLFPLSVSVGTWVVAWLAYSALQGALSPGEAIGRILLATMLAMGVLEHWMLVLPISPSALWRWALRHDDRSDNPVDRTASSPQSVGTASATGSAESGSASLRLEHDEKLLHARSA
jgi:putative photosynthetic complex assembly protein 2